MQQDMDKHVKATEFSLVDQEVIHNIIFHVHTICICYNYKIQLTLQFMNYYFYMSFKSEVRV